MDKNTIIGFVLIAAILIGFTWYSKPSEEELAKQKREQAYRDSVELVLKQQESERIAADTATGTTNKVKDIVDDFFTPSLKKDSVETISDSLEAVVSSNAEIISLENSKVKIDFSTRGGRMISAKLKDYLTTFRDQPDSLYLFKDDAVFGLILTSNKHKELNTSNLVFTPIVSDNKESLTMRFSYSPTQYIDFIYTLQPDDYMLKYDINLVGMQDILEPKTSDIFRLSWMQSLRRQEKSIKNEQRYTKIYYKYMTGDVEEMSDSKNEEKEVKEPTRWIAFKNQFFATILIADQKIETALLKSRVETSEDYLKLCDASIYVPANIDLNNQTISAGFRYYLGPMGFSHLKSYDKGIDADKRLDLDKLVPLGWTIFRWINQYFVIPIFDFLKSTGIGMGLVILLLTFIVKIVISPLTFKSFMSSAKMRVLRPQVEEINAKYPKQEQAMEKQRAVMDLYSRAGASPMSGCLPMLLQMPVLIALFAFFPNAIELRQQSFLWASDLSTYDAILEWKANIPIISWALGNHVSLFCLLMTATNIVYTKFNMDATNTGQQQMPGMKWMMYFMPLIFLFVLNDYPSGLTYYYFISTLITILLTISFRYFVNEEKLLAKLEANKSKPKKKSGFMARLEEAQRMQQQQLNQNKKGNKKKR